LQHVNYAPRDSSSFYLRCNTAKLDESEKILYNKNIFVTKTVEIFLKLLGGFNNNLAQFVDLTNKKGKTTI